MPAEKTLPLYRMVITALYRRWRKAVDKLTAQMDKHGLSDLVTTGVLSSMVLSRDVMARLSSMTQLSSLMVVVTVC
jgi:hypothetical protein